MLILSDKISKFKENFCDLYLSTNLTKTKFAKTVGLKHSQIEKYMHGTIPLISSVVKICDYFNVSIDYIVGLSIDKRYPNMKQGFNPSCFYPEYSRLLNKSSTTHFALAQRCIVTETSLSSWKRGRLPSFEVLVAIAYELGGSIDRMLGRI